MLPYTPLQHLLFAAGAPELLVMTSANRSSEPIAYDERDAFDRLAGVPTPSLSESVPSRAVWMIPWPASSIRGGWYCGERVATLRER